MLYIHALVKYMAYILKHTKQNMTTTTACQITQPCAVYTRQKPANPFVFSHFIDSKITKIFPNTLSVGNIKQWQVKDRHAYQYLATRTPVIILVCGDTARAFAITPTANENTPFLFFGSMYGNSKNIKGTPQISELHDNYTAMKFQSTLAIWSLHGDFEGMHAFPSCITIMPRVLRESDIPALQKNMLHCIQKCLRDSMWSCGGMSLYREDTLQIKLKQQLDVEA
jgi:hypothetical protein